MPDTPSCDLLMRSPGGTSPGGRPVVVAHRGASGYLPEHTLEAYALGAAQGADYIEPDLVVTKDGHLVARHENELSSSTDIASRPDLAHLRCTKVVNGRSVTGWFSEDLTLAQVRTLHARERIPELRPANAEHDGGLRVPSFADVLRLREELVALHGRPIGVYPELKTPTYFAGLGHVMEELLVAALRAAGLDDPGAPVAVQCFELAPLRTMRRRMGVVAPMVLLTEPVGGPWDLRVAGRPTPWAELLRPESLRRLGADVDVIGADKRQVIPWDMAGQLEEPTSLVADAHAAGLAVHVWTLRAENHFLPTNLRRGLAPEARGDYAAELRAYLDAGVDGVFTDHPDLALAELGRTGGVRQAG